MVDSSVTSETAHTQFEPAAGAELAVSSATGAASLRALPASVRPMIIATGPVIVAGSNFSTDLVPKNLTNSPAAIEIKPDMIIPNWA